MLQAASADGSQSVAQWILIAIIAGGIAVGILWARQHSRLMGSAGGASMSDGGAKVLFGVGGFIVLSVIGTAIGLPFQVCWWIYALIAGCLAAAA